MCDWNDPISARPRTKATSTSERETPGKPWGEKEREILSFLVLFRSFYFIVFIFISCTFVKAKIIKIEFGLKKSENSVFRQIYHLDYDFEFSVKQKKFLWFFYYFLLILHTHNTKLEYSEKFARQHANSMKFTLRNLLTVKLSKNIVPMKNIQSKYDLVYL